jgi:hypothetical protein
VISDQVGATVRNPRFNGDNLDRNLALVEKLRAVASELGISIAEAAIESAVPKGSAAGDRSDATQMATLDSER